MLWIKTPEKLSAGTEVVTPFAPRRITCAFHDIDGTHSRIREWVPVMTLVTGSVASYGMFAGTPLEIAAQIRQHREESFPEARRFAIESAGLSALTQMEWALRMSRRLNGKSSEMNEKIIAEIWQGNELFDHAGETAEELADLKAQASALFKAYEILLLEMGRNANLSAARKDPASWRIPGSLEFLQALKDCGVKNYFVTGAVVEYDLNGTPKGTMYEEIQALGYPVGPGELIEGFHGSTWDEKLPKIEIMKQLIQKKNLHSSQILVTGDGRSEIFAGQELGCLTVSRLDIQAERAREIHRQLHTHVIIPDFRNFNEIFFSIQ